MPLTRDDQELRKRASQLIAQGRLPVFRPARCWAGKGSRTKCSLCGDPVERDEVELEIEDSGGTVYRFHHHCHAVWELECTRADGVRSTP